MFTIEAIKNLKNEILRIGLKASNPHQLWHAYADAMWSYMGAAVKVAKPAVHAQITDELIVAKRDDLINYEWIVLFGLKLSHAATTDEMHSMCCETNIRNSNPDSFVNTAGGFTDLSFLAINQGLKEWWGYSRLKEWINNEKYFPYVLFLPWAGDLSPRDMNMALGAGIFPLNLVCEPSWADGYYADPRGFFYHDFVHYDNISYTAGYGSGSLGFVNGCAQMGRFVAAINKEAPELQKIYHFILFMLWHEESFQGTLLLNTNIDDMSVFKCRIGFAINNRHKLGENFPFEDVFKIEGQKIWNKDGSLDMKLLQQISGIDMREDISWGLSPKPCREYVRRMEEKLKRDIIKPIIKQCAEERDASAKDNGSHAYNFWSSPADHTSKGPERANQSAARFA